MANINWAVRTEPGFASTWIIYTTIYCQRILTVRDWGDHASLEVQSLSGQVLDHGRFKSVESAQRKGVAYAKKNPGETVPAGKKVYARLGDLRGVSERTVNDLRQQTIYDIGEHSDDDADYYDQPH